VPVRQGVSAVLVVVTVTACGRFGYDSDGAADAGERDPNATADAAPLVVERCHPDEIVCGNFEDGAGAWTVRGNSGGATSVGVVAEPALGRGALRVRTGPDGDGFAAAERYFDPITDGVLHGRAMLWVGRTTMIEDFVVALQLDDGNDSGTQKLSFDLMPYGGVVLTATTAQPAIRPGSPPDVIRRDAWLCLTFRIEVNQRAGSIEVTDGVRTLIRADRIDTVPDPGGFRRLLLGAVSPRPGVSELVFDAIALGWRPLSCAPAP
jgi:hypothetical protein